MATGSGTKRWTLQYAKRELAQWSRSGLGLSAYAGKQGYSAQRLGWWRKRLESEAYSDGAVELAPVVLTESGTPSMSVVVMPGGVVRLELADAQAVPTQWLGALVAALRQEV